MDMSKNPAVEASTAIETSSSRKAEMMFFLLALALIAALGTGFALAGIGGLTMVMVALVPVIGILLVAIAQGK